MAFVSMMFVFFLIAAVILGALLITGLVLLIVGIVRKCSQKNAGKKSPAVLIATGAVLLAIPVVLAVGLGIWGVSAAVSTAFKRTQYECVPDRWRNEWVTDSRAEEDILDALFTSADNGDREAFGKNFTPELQSREDFTEAVNAFFSAYPKGLAGCEQKDKGGGGSASYNYGHNVKNDSVHFNTTLGGEWYYISVEFCYDNTDEPDKVGVTDFKIMNLEGAAAFFDEYWRDTDYGSDVYLCCDIKSPDEVNARLIGGQPFLWTPTDTPKLTADELRELLKENKRLDSPALLEKLGAPNAFCKYVNSNAYEYYYELQDRNGQPCYAELETDAPDGEIFMAFICTPTEYDFDYTLFDEDNNDNGE
ncbi:MAG: DUF5104 domain-containing protein [Clostridia bacterium]|nr:DUF5104 domain-containing protein [Clostridia bacterium]